MIEVKVGGVGDAGLTRAIETAFINLREQALLKTIAQDAEAVVRAIGESGAGHFGSFAEADDAGDIFGSGTTLALMRSAKEQGLATRAATNVEDADALRTVEFVSGDAEHLATDFLNVDGNFSGSLDGIGMEGDAGLGSDFADLLDGLDDAGFVIGHHHADEFGVGLADAVDVAGLHDAGDGNRKKRDFDAALLGLLGGMEDGVVFDGGGNEMVTRAKGAEDGGVVALGAAGGEDDFGGAAIEQRGDLFAGMLDGGAGVLAVMVDRRGITKESMKKGRMASSTSGSNGVVALASI